MQSLATKSSRPRPKSFETETETTPETFETETETSKNGSRDASRHSITGRILPCLCMRTWREVRNFAWHRL